MRVHFVDARGRFHTRPFVYSLRLHEGTFDQYEEDTSRPLPLKFLVRGASYHLLGLLPARLHLFGVQDERIYLLGSDSYGRDQLSRFLYGGQVSLLAGLLGAGRSEEHTSELQSHSDLVCRLLLEKKNVSVSIITRLVSSCSA